MSSRHPEPLLQPQGHGSTEFTFGCPDWEDFGAFKKLQCDLSKATALSLGESDWPEVEIPEEEGL